MKIDAHQHFWKVSRGDYGWMSPASAVLYRDYLPADLLAAMRQVGVERTIVVQAAPTLDETMFLLELAEAHDWIAGVVGWLDFESPDFARALATLLDFPKLVGLRPMLQDLDDDAYIVRPQVLDNLRRVADTRLVFEYLTFTRHLDHVATSLREVPGLKAVIDHLSKPPIASGELSPWAEKIAAVAAFPNVSCKVSGMVTEADHAAWQAADLAPYVAHVLDVFGPERLIWGSDWPVALLAADYRRVHDTAMALLAPRATAAELDAIFGGNAQALYGFI